MTALAATIVILFSWLGVIVTLLTLPGTWLAVLAALLVKWWQPELLGWWAIGIAAGLAVLGEAVEFGAGAVGSKRAGGSRSGAWGALGGGLIGSVMGTVLIPDPDRGHDHRRGGRRGCWGDHDGARHRAADLERESQERAGGGDRAGVLRGGQGRGGRGDRGGADTRGADPWVLNNRWGVP